jgi:hypothetical protein
MTTWNWITAQGYSGTESICATLATDASIKAFLLKYDTGRYIVRHVERAEGCHWDGSKMSADEIAELRSRGGKR